jgi:hypothetical protein
MPLKIPEHQPIIVMYGTAVPSLIVMVTKLSRYNFKYSYCYSKYILNFGCLYLQLLHMCSDGQQINMLLNLNEIFFYNSIDLLADRPH